MASDIEHTATAPQGEDSSPALRPGLAIDHYVIEKELGRGGMGVVYAAFDTDLQRRVALKVLRDGLADESQQRLLREARAMARLQHPNVVTVYEVDSKDGRDYVAMEIIDGGPVVDWLRETPRGAQEIVEIFIAAGRGLAAAHAAGIVHRDFKPHNVLRSRGGRIVVTDFGLARAETDPLATTLPPAHVSDSSSDPVLTVPGAVLGTPAYMAPEQWSGGRLTAATDQFAFCIALWEALAGERPYRGPTVEALREQVTRGPEALDDSKIPRRLRAILRRGLSPDPAKRWPSMDALLARLTARTRRLAVVLVAGAAIAAAAIVFVMTRETTKTTCRAPSIDPATIGVDLAAWHEQRAIACAAAAPVRDRQLACLDRILARYAVIATTPKANAGMLAVSPAICGREKQPALPAAYSELASAALVVYAGATVDPVVVDRMRAETADPCVTTYVAMIDVHLDDAAKTVSACGDAAMAAEIELRRFENEAELLGDADLVTRGREATRILEEAGRADTWRVDAARGAAYKLRRRTEEALASYDAAIAAAPKSEGPVLAARKIEALIERGTPNDLVRARDEIKTSRPGTVDPILIDRFEWMDATAQWSQGETAIARPRLLALHAKDRPPIPTGERISGIVVDKSGSPVPGAHVATGFAVIGDSHGIATPLYGSADYMRMVEITTTDASGKFVLEEAPSCLGALVAQRGRERSRPALAREGARLVIEPTTHVRGRVDLGGRIGGFVVNVTPVKPGLFGSVSVNAPVAQDGRFEVEGVVPGDVMVGVGEGSRAHGLSSTRRMKIDARGLDDLKLELPAGREVRALLRGTTTFHGAPVFAVAGKFDGTDIIALFNFAGARQIATAEARIIGKPDPSIASSYAPGDLLATFANAPTGPSTICVLEPLNGCPETIPIRCVQLNANAALVVVE